MDETLDATLNFVDGIVEKAIRVQPGTDVCAMTLRLLYALGINQEQAKDTPAMETAVGNYLQHLGMGKELQCDAVPVTQPVEKPDFCAPYPASAMGGDSYDPMEATRDLPEFAKLPFKFVDEHSVIRVGEQTVVMNSAHYSDLLKLRQYAATAIHDEQVMRSVAEKSAEFFSVFYDIVKLQKLSITRKDGGFKIEAGTCGVVTTESDSSELRKALSDLLKLIKSHEQVPVTETPQEQSGGEMPF